MHEGILAEKLASAGDNGMTMLEAINAVLAENPSARRKQIAAHAALLLKRFRRMSPAQAAFECWRSGAYHIDCPLCAREPIFASHSCRQKSYSYLIGIFENKQKSLGRSKDNLGAVGNGPSISVSLISPAPAGNRLCRRCLNGYSKQGGTMNKLDQEK